MDQLPTNRAIRSIDSILQHELEIDPTEMTPEAKLIAACIAFVDPATYHGDSTTRCLFAQVCYAIGAEGCWHTVDVIKEWSGVELKPLVRIYDEVSTVWYASNYRASIEHAAYLLNVDLPRVVGLFNGRDNYTTTKAQS